MGYTNIIDKFAFASDGNASDVGDITQSKYSACGQSSEDHGYTSGGYTGSNSNVVDKFTFASDGNASDVGDLTTSRYGSAGQSSVLFAQDPSQQVTKPWSSHDSNSVHSVSPQAHV